MGKGLERTRGAWVAVDNIRVVVRVIKVNIEDIGGQGISTGTSPQTGKAGKDTTVIRGIGEEEEAEAAVEVEAEAEAEKGGTTPIRQ